MSAITHLGALKGATTGAYCRLTKLTQPHRYPYRAPSRLPPSWDWMEIEEDWAMEEAEHLVDEVDDIQMKDAKPLSTRPDPVLKAIRLHIRKAEHLPIRTLALVILAHTLNLPLAVSIESALGLESLDPTIDFLTTLPPPAARPPPASPPALAVNDTGFPPQPLRLLLLRPSILLPPPVHH
ncbi:hypothetical protein CALCODRAFT_479331 [Calocera cornea HHB12733]|uniref:Uncharacterized protein n=1 Tax=Calocera cornea HHB12733 TaxID=1353952 RepID=A0A165JQ93_9BASI|nr:hypothetical protein CALCODRAFT_479331 [Calocera cornea HHB12733]